MRRTPSNLALPCLVVVVACATVACTADPAPPAPPARSLADELYDPEVVQDIALEIAQADLDSMYAALPERVFVPGTFRWKDVELHDVGIRFKGNSSSFPPEGPFKRSYLIKLDEYVDGQELAGLRRIALDNGIQFGSLFSEHIINDILREAGVPAPRVNYARVTLNGEYIGVHVNVERIDKSFIGRHFADAEGNLYKCDEGGPGANLAYLGDDPAVYSTPNGPTFEAETNEDTADLRDVVDFIRLINTTPDAELAAALEGTFELDTFLKLMPVMLLSGAFDQYTGFQPHNYYLYRDPGTGRWTYFAHDLDVGFADNAFGQIPVIDGWNAANPVPARPPAPRVVLVERIAADPVLVERYRVHARDAVEGVFRPDLIAGRFDALHAQIRDDLRTDPFPPIRVTNPEDGQCAEGGVLDPDRCYDAIVASLKAFAERRDERARAELGL